MNIVISIAITITILLSTIFIIYAGSKYDIDRPP